MKHDHKEHKHEVKYCEKCDAVFCMKCNREWEKKYEQWHNNYFTYTGPATGTTNGGTDTANPEYLYFTQTHS